MNLEKIWQTICSYSKKGWLWLKPYLQKIKMWRKRIWKKYQINKIIVLLILVVTLLTTIYLFYLAKSADVSTLKTGLEQSTIVFDKDGDQAGQLGQKGTYVNLDQISPAIQNAVLSTEDRRFYEHGGFDIRGIGRAFVRVLINRSTEGGGGSTITQQLAKNAYLTQKQTFDRKARELFLAIEIEKKYSKEDILAMYLNNSYFGNGVWGVEDAAHKYFGKSAAEVTASEGAVLAGMLKGPSIYNPIDNMDAAVKRRDTVLELMVDNDKLSQEEASQAEQQPIALIDTYAENKSGYQYPYFFDAVINEATEKYGMKEEDILNRGYKIYTTLDQNYQNAMQNSFENDYLFPPNAEDGTMVQAASVVIHPKNGGVQAIVGGRGEHVFRGFNRGTQAKLPPGSTMKPLAVYTPALEAGYKTTDLLTDEPLSFYDVKNFDGIYHGQVPMYQAVAQSLNAAPIWLLHQVGLEKGVKKVEAFGIPLDKEDDYYGMALGGLTSGVSPLEMASAYSVFANQGTKKEAHFIRKIIDSTGKILVDNEDVKSNDVTTPEVAEEMTSMLQGVFSLGTAVSAQPSGYKMAGKTGSTETNYGEENTKDQWLVGYTPDLVMATWIGFDKSSENHVLTGSSSTGVAPIFKNQAENILPFSPQTSFSVQDVSQVEQENATNASESEWSQKVKEGANYVGEKVKEGANKVKEGISGLWDAIQNQ